MNKIAHNLFQRSQYEIALTDQRMGYPEIRRVDDPTVVKQDIDIHRARGITLPGVADTSEVLFDALAPPQHLPRVQLRFDHENLIQETLLGLEAPRFRLPDRRSFDDRPYLPHDLTARRLQILRNRTEISSRKQNDSSHQILLINLLIDNAKWGNTILGLPFCTI